LGDVQGRADRANQILSKAATVHHRKPRARPMLRSASGLAAGGVVFKDVLTGRIKF
jgi:hypothetical protein